MDDLLNQIEYAIRENLYYLALFASLSIPDICGALCSKNGEATGRKYIKWFDLFVGKPKNYQLSGQDCYYFRCSILHQGTTKHNKSNFQRIIFVEPSTKNNIILHNNIINDALNIDVQVFCNDLIHAARDWYNTNSNNNFVKQNYQKFIKRYPNGLKPFISGLSVIS